jgi:hypothetical protein
LEVIGVQKNELIHLHMLLFQVRTYFSALQESGIRTERYDLLAISPFHLHKGRKAHAGAILTLGDEIVSHILGQNEPPVPIAPDTAALPVTAAER